MLIIQKHIRKHTLYLISLALYCSKREDTHIRYGERNICEPYLSLQTGFLSWTFGEGEMLQQRGEEQEDHLTSQLLSQTRSLTCEQKPLIVFVVRKMTLIKSYIIALVVHSFIKHIAILIHFSVVRYNKFQMCLLVLFFCTCPQKDNYKQITHRDVICKCL